MICVPNHAKKNCLTVSSRSHIVFSRLQAEVSQTEIQVLTTIHPVLNQHIPHSSQTSMFTKKKTPPSVQSKTSIFGITLNLYVNSQ